MEGSVRNSAGMSPGVGNAEYIRCANVGKESSDMATSRWTVESAASTGSFYRNLESGWGCESAQDIQQPIVPCGVFLHADGRRGENFPGQGWSRPALRRLDFKKRQPAFIQPRGALLERTRDEPQSIRTAVERESRLGPQGGRGLQIFGREIPKGGATQGDAGG